MNQVPFRVSLQKNEHRCPVVLLIALILAFLYCSSAFASSDPWEAYGRLVENNETVYCSLNINSKSAAQCVLAFHDVQKYYEDGWTRKGNISVSRLSGKATVTTYEGYEPWIKSKKAGTTRVSVTYTLKKGKKTKKLVQKATITFLPYESPFRKITVNGKDVTAAYEKLYKKNYPSDFAYQKIKSPGTFKIKMTLKKGWTVESATWGAKIKSSSVQYTMKVKEKSDFLWDNEFAVTLFRAKTGSRFTYPLAILYK